jgi:Kef-type K+ transport system membrane component KefB
MTPFLEIGLIFGIATLVACVMQRLKLPFILGHIVTGIVVGPILLNLVHSKEAMEVFAQLGITALLFIVGIGLNPRVIRDIGRVAVVTGLGQIVFTSVIGFGLARVLGFATVPALFIAVALTFSSTIIIMKLLADRGDEGKLYGRISIGFLLVQDLVATVLLIVAASLAKGGNWQNALTGVGLSSVLLGVLVYLAARFLLPRLAPYFAQSQEFLFLFTIGWGVGLSALFAAAGLSVEIGALAAGVALASSPFRHEIGAKMKLLRDFFLVMFFILLGSGLTWAGVATVGVPALVFSVFVLVGNPLIVWVLMGALGYTRKTAFFAGLTVAQISEFSLILALLGVEGGFISQEVVTLLTIVGLVTITGSTLFLLYGDGLYKRIAPWLGWLERSETVRERRKKEAYDAIVFGCHRVGADFLKTLAKRNLKTLVVDFDPGVIERLSHENVTARYGDAHDADFIDELDLKRAQLVMSTVPDHETNIFLLERVRRANPTAVVMLVASSADEAHVLYDSGADYVIMPHYLGGNYAAMMLERFGTNKKRFEVEKGKHLKHLEVRVG